MNLTLPVTHRMEDEVMAFLAIDRAWPLMVRTVPDRIQRLATPHQPDTKIAQAINGDDSIVNTPPAGVPGGGPELRQWLIRRVNKPLSDRPGIPAPADSGRAVSACPAQRCRPDQPDLGARVRRRSGSSSRRFGRQAPGQAPWPGEPTSGSYSFRRTMRLGTMGGSLR